MKLPNMIFFASSVVLLLAGATASAKDSDIPQLQVDVAKLQHTVQELQTNIDAKNAATMLQMGKMADQMNNLTESMLKLTNLLNSFKTDNAAASASATKSANDTRDALVPLINEMRKSIDDLKDGQTAQRTMTKSLLDQIIAARSTTEAGPTCKDVKQDADRSYFSSYLEDAFNGYRAFLSQCASDPKAFEVRFQSAESLFYLKKFDQAVTEYDTFLQNYPANDKTATALLHKGLALVELKQGTDAKPIFARIIKEYPGTPEAQIATAKTRDLNTPAPAGRGARGTQ